jgi:hypothetical protein
MLWALADWNTTQPGHVRVIAIWAIGHMDPPVEEAARKLVPMCIHIDELTGLAAAEAVGKIGEPMVPYLLLSLAEVQGSHPRCGVVQALGLCGEAAQPAVPVLLQLYEDTTDLRLREAIDVALVRIGAERPGKPDAVAQLVAEMTADDAQGFTRYLDAQELGEMGPAAAAAVPVLMAQLNDPPSARVSFEALLAILPREDWGGVADAAAHRWSAEWSE